MRSLVPNDKQYDNIFYIKKQYCYLCKTYKKNGCYAVLFLGSKRLRLCRVVALFFIFFLKLAAWSNLLFLGSLFCGRFVVSRYGALVFCLGFSTSSIVSCSYSRRLDNAGNGLLSIRLNLNARRHLKISYCGMVANFNQLLAIKFECVRKFVCSCLNFNS